MDQIPFMHPITKWAYSIPHVNKVQEAVRKAFRVAHVVFNDQGLGNERVFQNEHFGGCYFAVDYNNPDFGALAPVVFRG